jgi:uncharacterized membrane protein YbhN (UPF0104 family)
MKKHLVFAIKLLLTVMLLWLIFRKIDIQQMMVTIQQARLDGLIFCVVFYTLSQFLNTYKWAILLHSHGPRHPYKRLLTYNFIGVFFNFFMPGMVGGDVQKCYAVYRDEKTAMGASIPKGRLTEIISSIMMARVTGVIAMIWHANIAYFFIFKPFHLVNSHDKFIEVYLPVILLVLLAISLLIIFLPICFHFKISHAPRKTFFAKVIQPLKNMAMKMRGYVVDYKLFARVMFYSLVFQGAMNLFNAFIGIALRIEVPMTYYFIAIPLITLCTAVPISLNGWGLRENSYAYFMHFIGITTEQSVLISLTSVLVVALNAGIGGYLILKEGFFIKESEYAKEESNDSESTD